MEQFGGARKFDCIINGCDYCSWRSYWLTRLCKMNEIKHKKYQERKIEDSGQEEQKEAENIKVFSGNE
ncbi:MAG: hypothetical protein ACLTXR_02670 [Clostridia bacterium]